MKRCLIFILSFLSWIHFSFAEELKGKVSDEYGMPLRGIIVRLYNGEKVVAFTTTDKDGTLSIKAESISLPARVTFTSKSYEYLEKEVENTSDTIFATLHPKQHVLEEVVVKVPHVRVNGDTITYDVASYTGNSDRSIEDVIKKFPGISIGENGTISYDGEPITHFYIEGMDLMGGNYSVASRNIVPSDISTVSVYRNHEHKKALKGVSSSTRTALNLKLKKNRMLKPVGFVEGGVGAGDKLLLKGKLYTMLISPNHQTIISANGNNTGENVISPEIRGEKAIETFSPTPFGQPSVPEQRYIDNKSGYATVNTMQRLKKDLTLTFNSSYGLDHDKFDGRSTTEYLAADLADPVYSESVDNGLRRHAVFASAKVENNSDRLYLNDQFYFGGYFNNNAYDIANGNDISQKTKNRHFAFYNDFSSVIKHGRHTVDIKSVTSFRSTPINRMSAGDPLSGDYMVIQNVTGKSFYNSESTAFEWKLSRKSSIGTDAAFTFSSDNFTSCGIRENTDSTSNDVGYTNFQIKASPYYKFVIPGKLVLTFTLPVELRINHINPNYCGENLSVAKVYVNPEFNTFWRPNPKNTVTLQGGISHSDGGISDFIDNPIYTTFRNSVTLGIGKRRVELRHSASLSHTLKNPLEGFSVRSMLTYSHREMNAMSVTDVSDTGTTSSYSDAKSHNHMTNLLLNASKRFMKIGTGINAGINAIWQKRESMRGGRVLNSEITTFLMTLGAETSQLHGMLEASTNFTYSLSHNKFSQSIPGSTLRNYVLNGLINFSPVKRLNFYAKLNLNRSQLAENLYKTNTFIDAGVRWAFGKFEIELYGHNLTNLRTYAYTIYHTLDISSYSYSLRPIEGMLSLRFSF